MRHIGIILCASLIAGAVYGQTETGTDTPVAEPDTIVAEPDTTNREMSPEAASTYLRELMKHDSLWRPEGEPMRVSLERLLYQYSEPFDSARNRLARFPYDSVEIRQIAFIRNDTLPVKWLNDSTLVIDTTTLERDPFITRTRVVERTVDTTLTDTTWAESEPDYIDRMIDSLLHGPDTTSRAQDLPGPTSDTLESAKDTVPDSYQTTASGERYTLQQRDTTLLTRDTVPETIIDTLLLESAGLDFYRVSGMRLQPERTGEGAGTYRLAPDSAAMLVPDTSLALVADAASPFYRVPGRRLPDSLEMAVNRLLDYTFTRDSIPLYIHDANGGKTAFWLSARDRALHRYWVKNNANDSVTIWMGNPSKYDVTLMLEDDVTISRIRKVVVDDIPISRVVPRLELAETDKLKEIPVYWSYDFSTSLAFNQTYLANWAKGGENSLSTMLDINGEAKYTNKEAETEWTNNARLKYGSIITEEHGLRTNTDMLEFNSQYNKVIREKIDFSTVFYMKNQLARGYNYPNDSVVVSKFLNPTTFTLGVGVEYKPFKKTMLNFSPLSYKNTFVLDTAGIDQTNHGIDADKKARQEMGGQLLIKNKISVWDGLNISNSLRLFSNYFDNPQNIDVDWEMSLDKRINWYFSVSLNLHLIYDDNIRFPVMDDNGDPVLLPDGSKKKVPKMQFKEFVGLTFAFKF